MIENHFEKDIHELMEGTRKEIIVEPNDFFLFREGWKNLPNREEIVGEASLNGRIIYRFIPKEE